VAPVGGLKPNAGYSRPINIEIFAARDDSARAAWREPATPRPVSRSPTACGEAALCLSGNFI
jgi:hypothetical protein